MLGEGGDVQLSLTAIDKVVAAALGLVGGGVGVEAMRWLSGKRKSTADVEALLRDALVKELDRREADCERRLKLLGQELRTEAEHRDRNLRQIIHSLAHGVKLNAKQRAIMDRIMPDEQEAA